ncbi:hypothetical protein WJX72_004714 [[Myrmecia] bisecta]|uniref:Protein kinase domain-containing protein n=1 Tax=[Myrmecia] bisecta TaxID=41462 RepID=A0AAW1Q0T9_9CHLO
MDEWFFTENGQKNWVEAMELNTLTPELPALLMEMGIRYDPNRLAEVLRGRWMEVNARALRVAATLGAFFARVAKDYAVGGFTDQNLRQRAQELRNILSSLGASFVKIGQALSSRPDLLPQPYLEALADLQDRLPSFPTAIAMTVIEQELGASIGDIFSELSPEPVAAASLGQVYKGRLRANGQLVAVKVQRPGIGDSIAIDMLLLRRLVAAVDSNLRFTHISQRLVPLVDEFATRLFGELDYVAEGKSCEKFQALYGMMPRVRTPGIFWDYTSRRVLTMEWIDGVKLTDKEAMARYGLNVVDLVDVGIECTMRQLLEHGYFHADPHPGNLLATAAGDLVYLDFGMMSEAPQYARYAIIAHVVHLVNRDYMAMCQDYYTLEFMDRSVDTSPIAPALAAFFDDVLDKSVNQLNFKAIVDGLGGVLFQFPFKVPAYYALILRSLTVLEGLALSADPQYKLLARAYPYMAKRLLTDPAPELRSSFEDLILENGRLRWNRLENLLEEGSKSSDFDASQLWLLGDWVISDAGVAVRKPVCQELVRLLDAAVADEVRQRIIRQTGNAGWAERLVPMQPGERSTAQRARLLLGTLTGQLAPQDRLLLSSGTGVFGLPNLAEIPQVVDRLQAAVRNAMPKLRELMDQPGAAEIRAELISGLSQRFVARAVKLVFGPQAGPQLGPRHSGNAGRLPATSAAPAVGLADGVVPANGTGYALGHSRVPAAVDIIPSGDRMPL